MPRILATTAWFCIVGPAIAQTGWMQLAPAVRPMQRGWNLLAHDLFRNRTVLFGGWSSFGDTWEWDGTNWAQRLPATVPSPRCCSAHGYDLIRRRIVMFGGYAGTTNLNDTWEYDGTNWVDMHAWANLNTLAAPSTRRLAGMAFDPVRGRMVLFGGGGTGGAASPNALADTWDWNGVAWTQLAPSNAPPARWSFGMTTDFANARILVHGGSSQYSNLTPTFTDTWSWDGANWTQIATAVQPPPVMSFGMTFDWNRGVPVLFGGEPLSNQTWLFAGNTWVQDPSPPAPQAQAGCTIAYGVAASRVLFFSGNGTTWDYGTPDLGAWLPFGAGCPGSTGVPLLRSVGNARPVVGTTFPLELVTVANSGLAAISIGFSQSTWSGGALPATLAPLGMAGCTLWADPQFLFVTPIASGRATLNWVLPNVAAFAGVQFYNQGFVLDPGVNALGAVVSNAGAAVIGTL